MSFYRKTLLAWIAVAPNFRCHAEYKTTEGVERCELPASHNGYLHYSRIGDWSALSWVGTRAVDVSVLEGETAGQGDSIGFVGLSPEAEEDWFDR